MRLEATIPNSRGSAVQELADQLGLSRSQLIDEALSLFLEAVIELRQGRKLMTYDPADPQSMCELTTTTLTTLEWALASTKIELPEAAHGKIQELVDAPAKANERLSKAAKRHGR